MFKKQACKGAFSCQPRQPIMTSEHSQDQKCLISPEGGKPDGLENPRGTAENQCTTQLTYGTGRESNQGHLGERRALYAQANRAMSHYKSLWQYRLFILRCVYVQYEVWPKKFNRIETFPPSARKIDNGVSSKPNSEEA